MKLAASADHMLRVAVAPLADVVDLGTGRSATQHDQHRSPKTPESRLVRLCCRYWAISADHALAVGVCADETLDAVRWISGAFCVEGRFVDAAPANRH
jgi:hypothetical protein